MRGALGSRWYLPFALLVAGALRIAASFRPMWYDEAVTYWQAADTAVMGPARNFSIIHVWTVTPLVGRFEQPWMLRLPFALVGTISVLLFVLAARRFMKREATNVLALLLAISPFHVYYSSELRMYAYVLFGTALALFGLVRAVEHDDWTNWFLYLCGVLVGLAAHLYTGFLLIVHAIYLYTHPAGKRCLKKWIATVSLALLGMTPNFLYALAIKPDLITWVKSRPLVALAGTAYSFVVGLVFLKEWQWMVLVAVALGLFSFLFMRGILIRDCGWVLRFLGVTVPLTLAIVPSFWVRSYNEQTTRYLVFAQPFFLASVAAGLMGIRNPRLRVSLLVGAALLFVTALYPFYFRWREVGMGNCDVAATELRSRAKPEDLIISHRKAGLPIAYYLRDNLVRRMVITKSSEIPTDLPPADQIWFVSLHDRSMLDFATGRNEPVEALPLPPPQYRIVSKKTVPGRKPLTLALYERQTD